MGEPMKRYLYLAIALFGVLCMGAANPWQAGGDLSGGYTSQTVVGVRGNSVPVPSGTNTLLTWSGSAFSWANPSVSSLTPGAAGTFLVSNSTPTTVWSTLDTFDTTHGRITAGGTGSDYFTTVGPCVGAETTFSCLYLEPNGEVLSATDYALQANAAQLDFNTRNATGTFFWTEANSTTLGALSGSANVWYMGAGVGAGAPLQFNWSTSTTPIIQSGTSATSLGVGTNKAGAGLLLQTDANVPSVGLYGGTQNGTALGANQATAGHARFESGFQALVRNAGNTGNNVLFSDDGSNNLYFGNNDYGLINVRAATNAELSSGGTIYLQAYSAGATLYIGGQTGTPTTTFLSGSTTQGTWSNTLLTISGTPEILSAQYEDVSQMTAPTAPAANTQRIYTDAADGKLKVKDNGGNVFTVSP